MSVQVWTALGDRCTARPIRLHKRAAATLPPIVFVSPALTLPVTRHGLQPVLYEPGVAFTRRYEAVHAPLRHTLPIAISPAPTAIGLVFATLAGLADGPLDALPLRLTDIAMKTFAMIGRLGLSFVDPPFPPIMAHRPWNAARRRTSSV